MANTPRRTTAAAQADKAIEAMASEPTHEPTERARPGRNDEIFGERRTRGATGGGKRLYVDESKLDRDKYHYRWITGDPQRVYELCQQGNYKPVPQEMLGTPTEHMLKGGDGNGGQLSQILVFQPKEWFDDDKRTEARKLDDHMEQMKAGKPANDGEGHDTGKMYKPNVENTIGGARESAYSEFEP